MRVVRDHLAAGAALRPGEPVILDDDAIDRLIPGAPEPRWACGVLFQVAARDAAAIGRGDYLLALNGLLHGAGLSLSRFSHLLGSGREGDDNPIVSELRRAWSVLERPPAIVAELTYNHAGRTANAGLRPSIFRHEIELPGDATSPGASSIPLRDLVVRFESHGRRFVVRRTSDGTEVIPVINSGVSPAGFVAFLAAVGEQGLQPVAYFPGFDADGIVRWPRVLAGRLVLFRERWVFGPGARPEPRPGRGGTLELARAVLGWRRRLALPRHVFVHSSADPKPRYFDLDAPVFLELLGRDLAPLSRSPGGTLHVTEMLPGPDEMFLRDDGGAYASELLVQMSGGPVRSAG
jgi:hypothetical protein